MDKKLYIQPQTEIELFELTNALLGVSAPEQGISYGGVDEDGSGDPDVKGESWTDIWE